MLILIIRVFCVNAQDILVFKDGIEESVKVLLVSDSEVRYKLYTHLHGPTYKVNSSDLSSIRYENGEVQKFENVVQVVNTRINENSAENDEVDFTEEINFYIQNGWGVGFIHRKEINPYIGWNILGVSFMSGWNNPQEFGVVNVRGLGFRFYIPSSESFKLYAEMNLGYSFIYCNDYKASVNDIWGNTYKLILNGKVHCFAFDFSTGFQINNHLSIGYNLTYLKHKTESGIIHWGKISILF